MADITPKINIDRIYIAGPIGKVNRLPNCINAIKVADQVMAMGLCPWVPHLDYWWNEISPKSYEEWLAWDFKWIEVCDAILRIPGESPGADREIDYAKKCGKPIFYSLEELKDAIHYAQE